MTSKNKKENFASHIFVQNVPNEQVVQNLRDFAQETQVGEVKHLKELGRGSYGVVSKCIVSVKGKEIVAAVKYPKKRNKEPVTDFFTEAFILRQMISRSERFQPAKRLVNLLGLQLDDTDVYNSCMVLNFCGRRNLKKYIENMKDVSLDYIRLLSSQVLGAVEELRSRRIIHRDIKMDNMVYSVEEGLTLCDFGVATN